MRQTQWAYGPIIWIWILWSIYEIVTSLQYTLCSFSILSRLFVEGRASLGIGMLVFEVICLRPPLDSTVLAVVLSWFLYELVFDPVSLMFYFSVEAWFHESLINWPLMQCTRKRYYTYTSVNLQFAKLEYVYIQNVTDSMRMCNRIFHTISAYSYANHRFHVMVIPPPYIYGVHGCTVHVGLTQACPNHTNTHNHTHTHTHTHTHNIVAWAFVQSIMYMYKWLICKLELSRAYIPRASRCM